MDVEKDATISHDQLLIVERYERVILYLYPIAQNIARRHGVAKSMFLQNFLGFRIWPRHKLLRKRSVIAAKRKISTYRRHARHDDLRRFVASWRGHACHADTRNLLNHLETHHGLDHQHTR